MASPSSPSPTVETLARLGPTGLVLLVSLVAVHGTVRLAERTVAAFALEAGVGPPVVGAAGSLALAVALLARSVDTAELPAKTTALATTLLAGAGLLTWAGARSLDAALGVPLTAAGWLLLGAALLGPWHARGPGATLALGDGGATVIVEDSANRSADAERSALEPEPRPSGSDGEADPHDRASDSDSLEPTPDSLEGGAEPDPFEPGSESPPRDLDAASTSAGAGFDRRTAGVAGALALAGGAVLATAAFSGTASVAAGFALLAATGAAAALVGALALGVADGDPDDRAADTGDAPSTALVRSSVSAALPSSVGGLCEAFGSLPAATRSRVVGEALVRVAVVSTSLFLVLVVAEYRAVELAVAGRSLPPVATFGLLVLAEAAGAALGVVAAPRLAEAIDRRWLLPVGLGIPALVPLALVATPSSVAVLAVLFALFGCRTAVRPLRPTTGGSGRAGIEPDVRSASETGGREDSAGRELDLERATRVPEEVRVAVLAALVPAPLLGGLLYAVDPVLAFALASTAGVLGVRELLEPLSSAAGGGT